ncbi:hypothetical protein VaNZ11_005296 [Volvox africanus]|uniref:Uncharacterized protein n=1 Tax=Volvox africanus TaxID=51714 RepID=A0ABQ5S039_9CHLO|nr:hypothetical protein VaNZ11_005296 [Volvox africanus]
MATQLPSPYHTVYGATYLPYMAASIPVSTSDVAGYLGVNYGAQQSIVHTSFTSFPSGAGYGNKESSAHSCTGRSRAARRPADDRLLGDRCTTRGTRTSTAPDRLGKAYKWGKWGKEQYPTSSEYTSSRIRSGISSRKGVGMGTNRPPCSGCSGWR